MQHSSISFCFQILNLGRSPTVRNIIKCIIPSIFGICITWALGGASIVQNTSGRLIEMYTTRQAQLWL